MGKMSELAAELETIDGPAHPSEMQVVVEQEGK